MVLSLPELGGGYKFEKLQSAHFRNSELGREKNRYVAFDERFRDGHEAWGYLDTDGQVAAYLWLSVAVDEPVVVPFECGLQGRIPTGNAYIWDCRVHTSHRGRGLYRHGLSTLRGLCAARKVSKVLIVTRCENTPSVSAISSVGFARFAVLKLNKAFGIVAVRSSAGLRILGVGGTIAIPDQRVA